MMRHEDLLELVPLYALDALEGSEFDEVERHLDDCPSCQELLAESYQVTSTFADDGPAPSHVWERIDAEITSRDSNEVIDLKAERGRRRWTSLALVAATVAVVVAGMSVVLNGPPSLTALAEGAAEDPGSFVGDFLVDDTSVAQVILGDDGVGYVIPTDSLPALGTDRTYQLWVITGDEKVISAGVLGSEPGASTFTWSGEVSGFALTREIAGGVVSSDGDVVSVITGV